MRFNAGLIAIACMCAGAFSAAVSQDTVAAPPVAAPAVSVAPAVAVSAGDTLAGPLPKMLTVSRSPYFVLSDIVVPQGQTVIIEPGTVLLFNAFTGLKVQGTLLARGESDRPIVFTSVNDQAHNPRSTIKAAAYDWNGVQVLQDAVGTSFSFCVVRYSVYGVMSMTRYIRIGPSLFQHNGRANLTIEGQEHVTGETPYEYNLTMARPLIDSTDTLPILRDPLAKRRNIVRYSSLGVLFTGAVLSAVFTAQFSTTGATLDNLSSKDPSNLATHSSAEWDAAESEARADRAGMILGYLVGIAGAVGFGWTFFF